MAGKTPRVVAGAYTNSFKDTKATALYNIDAATGSLVTQAPPNDGVLNTVGPLGITVTARWRSTSCRRAPDQNEAWLVMGGALYSVDLKTGKATWPARSPVSRNAQRYRLDELISSLAVRRARPVATRGGLSPLTGVEFLG